MAKTFLLRMHLNIRNGCRIRAERCGGILSLLATMELMGLQASIEPDLILLDLMLPGMSGHDFLERVSSTKCVGSDQCSNFRLAPSEQKSSVS